MLRCRVINTLILAAPAEPNNFPPPEIGSLAAAKVSFAGLGATALGAV